MCLGIPARVVEITDTTTLLGNVEVSGIKREVNLACVADERAPEKLIDQWVLVHVGFAMSIIDEKQARESLAALEAMQALEHNIDDFNQNSRQ